MVYLKLKRKTLFGGCNTKIKTSCCKKNFLYFCSNTNILITDEVKVRDVIYLDNFLNFVKTSSFDFIISGDVTGILYIITADKKIIKHKFEECLQDACVITENIVLCVFLKSVIFYNITENILIKKVDFDILISASDYNSELIFLGTADGKINIYDLEMNLKNATIAHEDRVQDITLVTIKKDTFLASSSKDGTVKIWEVKEGLFYKQTLVGHNDWVFQVNWTKNNSIISSSADRSIMIWNMNDNYTWECSSILGGAKPFLNAFSFKDCIIGQSQSGSFYKFDECISDFISGHTKEITSLDWNGEYLLSTSLDKTARIFYDNREVGRPITHGYELSAGRFLNENSLYIILGAQETIIRVLEPTYIFYLSCEWMKNNLKQIYMLNNDELKDTEINKNYFKDFEKIKIAAVPAELSLTNDVIEDYDFENVNEYLLSTTTFVEIKKIYGHYFEISDVAVSNNFIASCNKSLTKKFGGIFLWTKQYEILDYLEVHSYGIVRLTFSSNEKYLCAVSKDRTSSLYEIDNGLKLKFINKDHKRIVWDCSFSYDSKYYATCSRDRKIIIYELEGNKLISTFELNEEITALDFSPKKYLLVIGTEKGKLYKISLKKDKFYLNNDFIIGHSQRVNVIKFNKNGILVATGGKDGLINIYEL